MKKNLEDRVTTTERVIRFAGEFIVEILDEHGFDLVSITCNGKSGYLIEPQDEGCWWVIGTSRDPLSLEDVAKWIDDTLYNND